MVPYLWKLIIFVFHLRKRSFIDPAIVLSMFMLSFIFVIVCGLFEWERICAGFLFIVCLYYYCSGKSNYQDGRVGIPLNGLTRHIFLSVPSQDLDF